MNLSSARLPLDVASVAQRWHSGSKRGIANKGNENSSLYANYMHQKREKIKDENNIVGK